MIQHILHISKTLFAKILFVFLFIYPISTYSTIQNSEKSFKETYGVDIPSGITDAVEHSESVRYFTLPSLLLLGCLSVLVVFLVLLLRRTKKRLYHTENDVVMALNAAGISVLYYDSAKDSISVPHGNPHIKPGCTISGLADMLDNSELKVFQSLRENIIKGVSDKKLLVVKMKNPADPVSPLYIESVVQAVRNSKGHLIGVLATYRDVTVQHTHQDDIERMSGALQLAVESSEIHVWYYDFDNGVFYKLNESQFEKTDVNIILTNEYLHPDDREEHTALFSSLISGDTTPRKHVFRFKEPSSDRYRYQECHYSVITDEHGYTRRILITEKDVTTDYEKMYDQEHLIRSLNMAMQAGNIMAWDYNIKNQNVKVLYGNRDVEGHVENPMSVLDSVHPEERVSYVSYFNDVVSGSKPETNIVVRMKSEDETDYSYYEIAAQLMCDKDGHPQSLIGVRKDVSEIYYWQGETKRNINLLNHIYDNLPVGVELYDADGVLRELNERDMEMFGLKGTESYIGNVMMFENPFLPKDVKAKLQNGEDVSFVLSYDNEVSLGISKKELTERKYLDMKVSVIKDSRGAVQSYLCINNDITEKVEKEKYMEALTTRYQTMFRSISSGIEVRDANGDIVEANDAFVNIIGISDPQRFMDENKGLELSGFIPYDIRQTIFNKESREFVIEYDFDEITANNYYQTNRVGKVFLNVKTAPLIDRENQVLGTVTLLSDITQERQHQKALEEYKLKMDLALTTSELVQWDYNCISHTFNSSNERIKSEESQLTPQDYLEAIHPDDHRETLRVLKLMNEGREEYFTFNKRIRYSGEAEGVWHYATVHGAGLDSDAAGRIIKYSGFRQDNTKWHNLNTRLADNNYMMHAIMERMPCMLFIKDVSDDYRYVVANRLFCERLGKSEAEVVNYTDFNIFPEDEALKFRQDDQEAVATGLFSFSEETLWQGLHRVWHTTKSMFTTATGQQLLICMSLDITTIDNAYKELEQAKQKAEEADKLKSAFLANMSHEIRTPLNAIVGFSELLQVSDDPAERAEYMQIINTNNELLLRLIGDILDLSKIESGLIDLKREHFDLSPFIDDFAASLGQRVINPNVTFSCVNPYHKCVVCLDRNRLAQVFTNFVTNSIKYTEKGHIKMGYEYVNGGVHIYVEDTGIGIPKSKHHRIFQRFEKLDDFAQGTGLGLSICKAIIDTSKGKISFESEEGKGSKFWAWIPCEADIEVSPPELDDEYGNYTRGIKKFRVQTSEGAYALRILVAEDNDSNYMLVRAILKEYVLERARNGVEAVEFAATQSFDVILMDIRMPRMDGLEATVLIREFDKTTPIIAVTANAFDSDRTLALEAGCNDFITKPLKKGDVEEVLNIK